jgi:hypothetical protein
MCVLVTSSLLCIFEVNLNHLQSGLKFGGKNQFQIWQEILNSKSLKLIFRGGLVNRMSKYIFRGRCVATTVLNKNIFKDGCSAATATEKWVYRGGSHIWATPKNALLEAVLLIQPPLKILFLGADIITEPPLKMLFQRWLNARC